jgi:hypothetical protein
MESGMESRNKPPRSAAQHAVQVDRVSSRELVQLIMNMAGSAPVETSNAHAITTRRSGHKKEDIVKISGSQAPRLMRQ